VTWSKRFRARLADLDVVTGAFSYTGRFIAERLAAEGREVRSLSRAPSVRTARTLQFHDEGALVEALRGADVLYNTYWIRFQRGESTFARAVENTRTLLRAARRAGLRRFVHLSVTNADERSPFHYFRGKAETEHAVAESGLSYTIVRPTWIFGPNDILVNNTAWLLRRFPVFPLPGGTGYRVQPVSVEDVARLAVEAGGREDDRRFDAAGPETLTFADVVRLLRRALGSRARLVRAPPGLILALTRVLDVFARDVLITREELEGLRASVLTSHEPPRGRDSFSEWIAANGDVLGRSYVSELARNFRGYAPL
jgi:uncharacterized protein YbjT (DUF2867 family)